MAKAAEKKENVVKVRAKFDGKTRRFFRYSIKPNEHGITGSVYIDLDEQVPDKLEVTLLTEGESRGFVEGGEEDASE